MRKMEKIRLIHYKQLPLEKNNQKNASCRK